MSMFGEIVEERAQSWYSGTKDKVRDIYKKIDRDSHESCINGLHAIYDIVMELP